MTQWGYEDNDSTSQGNSDEMSGPKALRDAYEKLKAQNEELNSKLTSFLEDQSKQKVSQVFDSLGIPGAASVYQGPADPDKAREWAESMKSVFGNSNQGNTPPVVEQQASAVTPDQMQQLQAMTQAGQNGQPLTNFEAAQAAVNNADSIEALIAAHANALRQNGS